MIISNVKNITIPQGNVVEIKVGGVSVWKKQIAPNNLWNANKRIESVANVTSGRILDEEHYLYPISYTGWSNSATDVYDVSIDNNGDVTFISNITSRGVGFPYTTLNGNYSLTATASSSARLRVIYLLGQVVVDRNNYIALNANVPNTLNFAFDKSLGTYDSVLLMLEARTTNTPTTFSDITLYNNKEGV